MNNPNQPKYISSPRKPKIIDIKRYRVTQESYKNAKKRFWLVENVLPNASIGILYGKTGSGKTTYILHLCEQILKSHKCVRLTFIDADMGIKQQKEYGFDKLMASYPTEFRVFNVQQDICDVYEAILKSIVSEQNKFKNHAFVVFVDSLNRVAKKKNGFINKDELYKIERKIRQNSGAVLILHHTNKKDKFADTQQIEDYTDYVMKCENDNIKKIISIKPEKTSRFSNELQTKCYKYDGLKIIEEIPPYMANFSDSVIELTKSVLEQLKLGRTKQSDILEVLNKNRKIELGQNKKLELLKKFADEHHLWHYEQAPQENNAIYYFLKDER